MSATVYLSKLVYGQKDSDSVRELQRALNAHPLKNGATIAVNGNYDVPTDAEVRKDQAQHLPPADPVKASNVGPQQAEHLFGPNVTIVDDRPVTPPVTPPVEPPEPPVTPPIEPPVIDDEARLWMAYSGKPGGDIVLRDGGGWKLIDVDTEDPPISGSEHHMLYARVNFTNWNSGNGMAKLECKYVREDGDETAFDERHYEHGTKSVPFQMVHFETGKRGQGGRWYMKTHGGGATATITTRYNKAHTISAKKA